MDSSGNASSAARLPAALQSSLTEIVERSQLRGANIQAILLSTTDGAPLGRGYCTLEDEDAVAAIESSPHCKHMQLLGMGGVRQVTALYDHGTLLHVYQGAMVGSTEALNSGSSRFYGQVARCFCASRSSDLWKSNVADMRCTVVGCMLALPYAIALFDFL